MAPSSLLQHSNGHAGIIQWLNVLSNCLISAHLAGPVFLTGIPLLLVLPTEQDDLVSPTTTFISPPPSHVSAEVDDDNSGISEATDLLPTPTWKYDHESPTRLSDRGHTEFIRDRERQQKLIDEYGTQTRDVFTHVLACLSPSTLTTITNRTEYAANRDSTNLIGLRSLLFTISAAPTVMRSFACVQKAVTTIQGNLTTENYRHALSVNMLEVATLLEHPDNPGFIKTADLEKTLFVNGLNNAFKPLLDQLILSPVSFADLTHADICDKAAAFEQNQHNYTTRHSPNNNSNNNSNNNINTPAKHPAGHKTTTQKNPDNNNRQPANQALSTASTTTSQWTPAHPHTRPPGNGSGPGRSNQPHCTHCAKNGHVFNNHGFEGAAKGPLCHDLARIDPTAPTPRQPTNEAPTPATAQAALLNAFAAYLEGTPLDIATVRSAGSEVAPGSI